MKQITSTLFMLLLTAIVFGQTATPPSEGDGTSSNPYQIETLDNLYWLSQNSGEWGKHYIQTADIDASGTSTWDGGAGFLPIGNTTTAFSGTYDGQNHTIDGLTIDRSSIDFVALFGITSGATIQNLGITNASIVGYKKKGKTKSI